MAKTWDTSRTGGGTYEFTQDPQGRYTLRSVGFKSLSKLNLPELKTEAAATTAVDAPKDVAALSAQTTEAFGDVTPFYYDQEGRTEDPKYVTMRKEDTARDLEVNKRVPTVPAGGMEGGVWGPMDYLQPRKEEPDKEVLPRYVGRGKFEDTNIYTGLVPDTKDRLGRIIKKGTYDKAPKSTATDRFGRPYPVDAQGNIVTPGTKTADKIKPVERFPPGQQFRPQKISPYQDAIMRGEAGVKYEKPGIRQKVTQKVDVVKTALSRISTGSKTLMNAVGLITNPAMAAVSMVMGVIKPTNQGEFARSYFNAEEGGRISGNPNTGLYSGMNRESAYGDLQKAGEKRLATRQATIDRKGVKSASNPNGVSQQFVDNTDTMRKEDNNYKRDLGKNLRDKAKAQGKDISNPNEMRGSGRNDPAGNGKDGKGIICTQMYQQTKLEDWKKTMQLWYIFQKKYLTIEHQEGYHFLFKPFVKGMKKSKILTAIGKYCAIARTKDLKHIMFGTSFSFTGRLVRLVSEPICYLTGKIKSWL